MNLDPITLIAVMALSLVISLYTGSVLYVSSKVSKRLKLEQSREKLLCIGGDLIKRGDFRLKTVWYLEAELKTLKWYQPLQQIVLIRCIDTLRQTAYSDTFMSYSSCKGGTK